MFTGNNQVSQFQKHNANKDNCQSAKRSFKGTSAASNISTDIGTKNYQSGLCLFQFFHFLFYLEIVCYISSDLK